MGKKRGMTFEVRCSYQDVNTLNPANNRHFCVTSFFIVNFSVSIEYKSYNVRWYILLIYSIFAASEVNTYFDFYAPILVINQNK